MATATKLTAKRLEEVEAAQTLILDASRAVEDLAEREREAGERSSRVVPLSEVAKRLRDDVDLLERLYA